MQVLWEKMYFFYSSLCDVITALPVREAGRLKGLLCSIWLIIYTLEGSTYYNTHAIEKQSNVIVFDGIGFLRDL